MKKKRGNTINFKLIGRYKIFDGGNIYSNISKKYLKPDIVGGYIKYTLILKGKRVRKSAHQWVAMCFLPNPNPKIYNCINHIDGNKKNNYVSNLEWSNAYLNNKHARDTNLNNVSESNSDRWNCDNFREKTSKNISQGLIDSQCSKNENNPRYKYQIKQGSKVIYRKELSKITGLAQSTTDRWIKRVANGDYYEIFENFNITIRNVNSGQQTTERIADY